MTAPVLALDRDKVKSIGRRRMQHPPPVGCCSNRIVAGDDEEEGCEGQGSLEASLELDSVNHDGGRPPDRPILHKDWEPALSARPPSES